MEREGGESGERTRQKSKRRAGRRTRGLFLERNAAAAAVFGASAATAGTFCRTTRRANPAHRQPLRNIAPPVVPAAAMRLTRSNTYILMYVPGSRERVREKHIYIYIAFCVHCTRTRRTS